MSQNAKHATKKAVFTRLGETIALPAPYAAVSCPVRSQRVRFGGTGLRVYVLIETGIATRTVTGDEVLLQIDTFATDPALAEVAAGEVERLVTEGGLPTTTVPNGGAYSFPSVSLASSITQGEEGPDNEPITHVITELRIRATQRRLAFGRF